MPSTARSTAITILTPRAATMEAGKFSPREALYRLPFWEELTPSVQSAIESDATELAAARIMHGSSGLAIGYYLSSIKRRLESHEGAFERILRSTNFSRATGYRYISQYATAAATVAEPILRAAMARGMNLPGRFADALDQFPPPRALASRVIDAKVANEYLDGLKVKARELRKNPRRRSGSKATALAEVKRDPNLLLMQSYRHTRNALNLISANGMAKRRRFLESLVGMLLSECNIQSKVTFEPEAIPAEFKQGRGRPRLAAE